MTRNSISIAAISLLTVLLIVPVAFRFQSVAALTDASSTTTTADLPATNSTSTDKTATTSGSTTEPALAIPPSLTLVHTAGTKYIDYCTDGTKVTAYPGDPAIDSHFNVPDAPTPKCPDGQAWDHTSGAPGYDTASGDLDVGDYAQQTDGTYIVHYAATTYTDATSTSQWPDRFVVTQSDPRSSSDTGKQGSQSEVQPDASASSSAL